MRYSLRSRFRATLLAAVLGQSLPANVTHIWEQAKPKQYIASPTNEDVPWGCMATAVTKSLIHLGKFDSSDAILNSVRQHFRESSSVQVIIATLPLALFYHDSKVKLQQNLQQFLWFNDPEIIAGSFAVGYTIALSLQEKLRVATLIPQLIDFLDQPQLHLTRQLAQVQSLLEHKASLVQATTILNKQPNGAIALAFYCFLSTSHDLQLSVTRASHIGKQSHTIAALTGALSGAYNGLSGIPTRWRIDNTKEPLLAWGFQNEAELLELCDSLVAVWSGAYNSTDMTTEFVSTTAIAAPRVIRPR